MARLYEEILVVPGKRPLPGMALNIIKNVKARDRKILEILFDPEEKAFKILCESNHGAAASALVNNVVTEKLTLDGNAFQPHHTKLRLDEYDCVRFPEAFAEQPFRAMLNLSNNTGTPGTLASIMSNCGYDNAQQGCEMMEKITKALISCNMAGTTIYFGAKTQADLNSATCLFQFISEAPAKSSRSSNGSRTTRTPGIGFGRNMPGDIAAAIQLNRTNTPGPHSRWRDNAANRAVNPAVNRPVDSHVDRIKTSQIQVQTHPGSHGYPDIVETWVKPFHGAARATGTEPTPVQDRSDEATADSAKTDKLVDVPEPEHSVESDNLLVDRGQIPNIMDM
ncbi:hypothetical protein SODALDRAFT_320908 [Sodiomyces alkalinus F11]|uniref:Uncharacterized protein n=1 Tax=Sodiomyces alkalinus (strain CBS 110278 / VKM F-3762 / F11) TaxID=1314773 RepID=A0A3N2PM70_SODAK|nr:hypothetical protein SODALDRAFT_320908 [Sodiomyces alkalinus F11]ROT35613.1 hypothetical protein SODALDRAFT_320908 [Sodiomyces alkalinus F11]